MALAKMSVKLMSKEIHQRADIVGMVMAQVLLKAALKKWGKGAEESVGKEMKQLHWPQLRRAPNKFGRFIKLYNINDEVFYKQTNMGFAAEAGFLGGGKGPFCPPKRCNSPSAGYGYPRKKYSASSIRIVSYCKYDVYFNKYDMYSIVGIDKKAVFWGGGERGRFAQKKGVKLLPLATDFWEKNSPQAQYVL